MCIQGVYMKKLKITLTILSLTFLSGCAVQQSNVRQDVQKMDDIIEEFSLDIIPFLSEISYQTPHSDLFVYNHHSLVIRNLINNQTISKISHLPDHPAIFDFENYYVVYFQGFRSTSTNDSGFWFHVVNTDNRVQTPPSSVVILNTALEIIYEREITDFDFVMSTWLGNSFSVRLNKGNIYIYYTIGNSIRLYDVSTNESSIILDLNCDLRIDRFSLIDYEQIAFVGTRRNSNYVYFGTINLNSKKINDFYVKFSRPYITVYENYMLIKEDWGQRSSLQNQIVAFNFTTNDFSIINVGYEESLPVNSTVINNTYILTATSNVIRVYCIMTGEKVLDRSIKIEVESVYYSTLVPDPQFTTIIPGSVYAVVFDIIDPSSDVHGSLISRTLHTEFIIVDN